MEEHEQLNGKIATEIAQYLHAAKWNGIGIADFQKINNCLGSLLRIIEGQDSVSEIVEDKKQKKVK